MKIFFTISLFFLVSPLAFGQLIHGRITDAQTHEAIAGASVSLSNLNIFMTSDADGRYAFKNIKAGQYLIEVISVGYKTHVKKIDIQANTVVNFELSESVNELSEVVVTGMARSTELRETPLVIKSIDKKSLFQNTAANLIDALSNVPGMSSLSTGPAIAKPMIRGLGYNRVLVLNNGIRQEGQQWGDEHGVEIDEYAIDKVEIIKGPGSLMYGSDGIAGVLNFLAPNPMPIGEAKTQYLANYQSNNRLIGQSIRHAQSNENGWSWLGQLTHKMASNYQNPYDGRVANSGFREWSGNVSVGITKQWGYSRLWLSTWNNTLGLPEGERDANGNFLVIDGEEQTLTPTQAQLKGYALWYPRQVINHTAITQNNYFILKKGSIHFDWGWQYNNRRELESEHHEHLSLGLQTLSYNLRYNLPPMNHWETSVGVSGMWQGNTNKGEEALIPNYQLFDAGLFVSTQKKLGLSWVFAGGARVDTRRINAADLGAKQGSSFSKNIQGFSGSLGLSWLINAQNTLKFNVSQGYRAPNMAELASNGKHEGTFRYELGNRGLKPENSVQIDLAYFFNSDHVTVEVSPYVNRITNYIYAERLKTANGQDVIMDPADPAPTFEFRQGQALLYGGEIYTDLHPHPLDWLHIENSFSWVRGIQLAQPDSTRNLPMIPAARYRGELRAEIKTRSKTLKDSYIRIGFSAFLAQNSVLQANETETPTPAYSLLNVGMGATLKTGKKSAVQLILNVENLTDVAYQSHLSRLKYAPKNPLTGRTGIFNSGRNVSIKAIWVF